jgi:hypothetical protein
MLEEEVDRQAEDVKRLKEQRKELEDYVNMLLGKINSMERASSGGG